MRKRLGAGRPSRTAEFAAIFRAGALLSPPELRRLEDPYAEHFVRSPYLRTFMRRKRLMYRTGFLVNRYYRGIVGQTVMRSRYADDQLRAGMEDGIEQVVMLGSGYDATSVRFAPSKLRFFEVDHPETQRQKREVLGEHAPHGALDDVVFVPCDFNTQRSGDRLVEHGFDPSRPTFVNWLAVSWYIPRESVESALRDIAKVTAPGSRLLFDYLHGSVVNGRPGNAGARRSRRRSARVREPWEFGIEPGEVPGWLRKFGFEVLEQLSGDELDARYYSDGNPMYSADYIGHVTAERTA